MKKLVLFMLVSGLVLMTGTSFGAVSTFDDLSFPSGVYWNGADGSGGFNSGEAIFYNSYTDWGGGWVSWDGWAYSRMTDTTTAGYGNQYSAITGGGVGGSANYGVAYDGGIYGGASPPTVSFGSSTGQTHNATISGAYFTNTTYAYLSMRDGEGPAKKFGGVDGSDPDFFQLIVRGTDGQGGYTGAVEFYLADFQDDDNSLDYIVDEWTWVDLSSLGNVAGLEFSFDSSDTGDYGINTPLYFAMDDLEYTAAPIPASVLLLGSGLLGVLGIRHRKKS